MENRFLIYQNTHGNVTINVRLEDENIWLTQQQMAELYLSSRTNVVEHIRNIHQEGELNELATCRKFRQVQMEGKTFIHRTRRKSRTLRFPTALCINNEQLIINN